MGADRKIKADEKHIDELRAKLRPIDKACDDAHKALGDSIRNAERDLKGLDDDLRDLERKADRIKKKLEYNDELIATERKDPYKDKERDDELNGIQKEHDGERKEYLDMKKKAEDLRKKYGELRKNLDVAKKDSTKISPEELQIEIEKVNNVVNAENDRANQIEVDVDETRDKLEHFVRKYDDKKKRVADAQRKCADELRELNRLNNTRIPEVKQKLDNMNRRLEKLPPTSPVNQQRADALREDTRLKLKEMEKDIIPEGKDLYSRAEKHQVRLNSIPTKLLSGDEVNEIRRDLDLIEDKRVELKHRLKEPDSMADDGNKLADDLIRLNIGNRDLNNKLKAKDLEMDLRDAQRKLDETLEHLDKANEAGAKAVKANPANKMKADVLRRASDAIRAKEQELQKKKDELAKRVGACKSAPPENAGPVEKDLEKLEKEIDDLHKDINGRLEQARNLNPDFDKETARLEQERKLNGGVERFFVLNDDLEKKLAKLNKCIATMEPL